MAEVIDVVRYLLRTYPHEQELSNARVTKMIYLADWHQALNWQRQITGIEWYFDNYGPFVWDVLDAAKAHPEFVKVIPTTNFYGGTKTLFATTGENDPITVSSEEKSSLDHIIEVTESLYWNDFIRLVYSTRPVAKSPRYSVLDLIEQAQEQTSESRQSGG